MHVLKKVFVLLLLLCFLPKIEPVFAQKKDLSELTRQDVLEMDMEQLLEMPLDDLLILSKIAGVSVDELFKLVHETEGVRSGKVRTQLLSAIPVEVYTSELIENSGQVELGQVLQFLSPAFHSAHQTIADGTDNFDPSSLRGLAPDQMLVLINGKRRHSSSYLHVNGTFGRGTVGTDFNTIPVSAIERIEIFKDGAAAQYGSDAIAGVINIVLKEKTEKIHAHIESGITKQGDGERLKLAFDKGVELKNGGFINVAGELFSRGMVNRSGNYTGTVYGDSRDNNLSDFFAQVPFDDHRVMSIGSAALNSINIFVNSSFALSEEIDFYSFGGFSIRQSEAPGFYRFPKEDHKVVLNLYPNGFSPSLLTNVIDKSFSVGLKTEKNGWTIDFNNTIGANTFELSVENANNASMGMASPTSAFSGGFNYWQNLTGLNIIKPLKIGQISAFLAFGAEYRVENYRIVEGETASWKDGGDTSPTNSGESRQIGFQYYPGFRPENVLSRYRTNSAIYADAEIDLTKKWMLELASRYESYSDFGNNLSWKVATRYRFAEWFTLRGSASTGFRAPSLPQIYYNRISTQFLNDQAVQVVNFNNESSVVRTFGIEPLKPELSKNLSVGITSRISEYWAFTVDGYLIGITDRIVMSGRFKASDDPAYAAILDPLNVSQAQFFTNAIDTKTRGIDFILTYNKEFGFSKLLISAGANFAQTRLDGQIKTTPMLQGKEDILFNREEVSRIEALLPQENFVLNAVFQYKKMTFTLRNTYLGEVKYVHPDDGDPANWQYNELTNRTESRDQTFSPKLITDIAAAYQITDYAKLRLGINNFFDVYPDKHKHSANISEGKFVYSRRVQHFNVNGIFFYLRLAFEL